MTAARSIDLPASAPRKALAARLAQGGPLIMGVLNITPDSFSDGGRHLDARAALAHAEGMIAAGAAIIDIGAESTRPYGGMQPVSAAEELSRLKPVLADLVALGTPVSIDTMKAEVARSALQQGVAMLNDVWGLQRDAEMARVAAEHDAPVVVMHNRAAVDPAIDVMEDIAAFFERSFAIAAEAGIKKSNIILDPGIGFGKTAPQSMTALAHLAELSVFGCPILVGASRKRFIASVSPSEPQGRLGGSIAAHLIAAEHGAKIIRTHDVAETVQALKLAAAIEASR
jgi:dihydropteroate synthase